MSESSNCWTPPDTLGSDDFLAPYVPYEDDEEMSDDEKHDLVIEHIADMESGEYGEFFAPEGGPSFVNDVRAETIAEDYLSHRHWRLPEEWAAELEEFIHENREAYEVTWWDEEKKES